MNIWFCFSEKITAIIITVKIKIKITTEMLENESKGKWPDVCFF